jgi:hypothetical protein
MTKSAGSGKRASSKGGSRYATSGTTIRLPGKKPRKGNKGAKS